MKSPLFGVVCAIHLSLACVSAHAASYSFSVDRFEITGNLPGSFVDDFNDGDLSPVWEITSGSAVEANGFVTLSDPGKTSTEPLTNQLVLEREESEITTIPTIPGTGVADGAGDFEATSTWMSGLPTQNQSFGMSAQFVESGPGAEFVESFSIGLLNGDADLMSIIGAPAGLYVVFSKEVAGSGVMPANTQLFSIVASDVTGDILLRLLFDDDANQYSGAFSLDGGAIFQNPFAPFDTAGGTVFADWELGAGVATVSQVPIPSAIWLFGSGLLGMTGIARRRKAT